MHKNIPVKNKHISFFIIFQLYLFMILLVYLTAVFQKGLVGRLLK